MKEQEILELLPDHFAQLKQMKEIAKVEGIQLDKLDAGIDDLLNQGFINTATWGLRYWEERYMLPILEDSLNYEQRRRRVLTKKRSNKANLVDILRAIEPTIELGWGGNILPFTIDFEGDYYDFGELVRVLEDEKPSHLSYSFSIKPDGYTVRADHRGRNEVGLQLTSGTAKSGRYPRYNTRGESLHRNIGIQSLEISGVAELQKSAGIVSGAKDKPTSFGSVEREHINISSQTKTGLSKFNPSGQHKSGNIAHKSIGSVRGESVNVDSISVAGDSVLKRSGEINTKSIGVIISEDTTINATINTGLSTLRSCGSFTSGEGVA